MKKYLNLLLALLLVFGTVDRAFASGIKFMVISDVHISMPKGKGQSTKSINNLQKAVKMVNDSNVDFVIFPGDNVENPNKDAIVMFAKIINKIDKPAYVILGNHDVAEVMGVDKKEYFRLLNKFSHNKIREVPSVRRIAPDLVFIFMDGVNQFIPGQGGNFKDHELIWLDKKLTKYKRDKVVIVQHFPVVEPRERKGHRVYKVENYLGVLSKHDNVIAMITGHYHFDNVIEKDGIVYISVPSLAEEGLFHEINIEKAEKNGGNKYLIKTKTHEIE